MKEFVVSAEDYKAKLKIGDSEFKFRSPTAREVKSFSEQAKELAGKESEGISLMEDLLGLLGNLPKDVAEKLPADTLIALTKHLVTPFGEEASKKN